MGCLFCMSKMTARFLLLALAILLVTCGSKVFRMRQTQRGVGHVLYPFAVLSARQRVMPHLHYAVDMHHMDKERGIVELSFFFVKSRGDSLQWVECVEKVPLSLVDTAQCYRWRGYE